jgi:hypothetical protein
MKSFSIWKLGYKITRNLEVQPFTDDELSCPSPFKWQSEFEEICENLKVSLVASTGAGKSRAIKVSSHKWNAKSRYNKSIIVVPQTAIGAEFGSEMLLLGSGETVLWSVSDNLCRDDSEKTIHSMVDFIRSCPENPDLRTIVCCQQTLCGAYDIVKDSGEYKNIKLIVDEAHHVSTGEDYQGNFNPNKVGKIFLDTLNESSNSILLVTATHFRTDETTIIPTDQQSGFIHFEVPFYRVQDECRFYNKQIQFNYAVYKTDVHEGLKNCFDERLKTIIFIHPKVAMEGKVKKHRIVKNVVESIGEIVSEDKKTGTYSIKTTSGKMLIVADLVSETFQCNAKEYIRKVSKDDKSFVVDVIIAMKMFMEGSDYPPLQHCIIHGIRDSYGNIIQMAGRVTRDFKDKTFCRVTMLLPHDLNIGEDNAREILNNHLKFIVASMSLANFFKPVYLRIKNDNKQGDGYENITRENPLSIIGDDIAQNKLRVEAIKTFSRLSSENEEAKKFFVVRLEIMKTSVRWNINIKDVSDKCVEDIASMILNECALSILSRSSNIDINNIEYDFLNTVDTTGFLFNFCSDLLSSKNILDYRKEIFKLIGEKKSFDEHVNLIKSTKIRGSKYWMKHHNENKLAHNGYYINPWKAFNMTIKDFFRFIWGEKKSFDEHVNLIKKTNITGSHGWHKYRRKNRLSDIGYKSQPWRTHNMTEKEFFNYINGDIIYKTKQDHIDLIKKLKITYSGRWKKYHKENKLSESGYYSNPWTTFNVKITDLFGRKSLVDHIDLIKIHKITNSCSWKKYYEENKLLESGYLKHPWRKLTVCEFFNSVWGGYRTKQEHIDLIKKLNITGVVGWKKYHIENKLEDQNYYKYPGKVFCNNEKVFYDSIFGKKYYRSISEHVIIMRNNGITNSKMWIDYVDTHKLVEAGYYKNPWDGFDVKISHFFNNPHPSSRKYR